jgi:hypothetical protein
MRIFDRIASGSQVKSIAGDNLDSSASAELRKRSHEAVRIVADEAAQFYWQTKQEFWELSDDCFGPLRPPFDDMWLEWKTPKTQWTADGWQNHSPRDFAFLVSAKPQGRQTILSARGLMYEPIYEAPALSPVGGLLVVNESGHVLSQRLLVDETEVDRLAGVMQTTKQELATTMLQMFYPGLLAVGWINCKNIRLETNHTNDRIARKRQRRGSFAGLSYEKIVIDGVAGQPTRSNREAHATGKRLHMVRGHFATYTTERPLFGRITGTFWRAWHVRGDADLGRISHEYQVQGQS